MPTLVVDAGNALHRPRAWPDAAQAQAREAARVMAGGLHRGGIDVMTLGEHDGWLGLPYLQALVEQRELPVIVANLTCSGEAPFPESRIAQVGDVTVGVVGVTSGTWEGCEVADPRIRAESALDRLGDVDVAVLLAPLDERALAEWATTGSDFDLVVSGEASIPSATGMPWGSGHQVQAGTRGKQLGVATLTVADGRVDLSSHALVPLSEDAGEDDAVATWVAEGKAVMAAAEEQPMRPIDTVARRVAQPSVWAGRDTCVGCHPSQDARWQTTAHAHAWTTLDASGRGLDRSCVGCHVTGWEQDGGPAAPAEIGAFRGVQCESCHGPASAHVADPSAHTPVRSPDVSVCTGCHDGERDGGRFDHATYLPQVDHTGGATAPHP